MSDVKVKQTTTITKKTITMDVTVGTPTFSKPVTPPTKAAIEEAIKGARDAVR